MTGADDTTVSRSETTEVTSAEGTGTETRRRTETHEVHEEAWPQPVVETTTTTTIIEE